MNKLIAIFFLAVVYLNSYAQASDSSVYVKEEPSDDTTYIRLGKKRTIIIINNKKNEPGNAVVAANDTTHGKKKRDHVSTTWLNAEIGVNTYLNDFSTTLPDGYKELELNLGKSINFNLNIFSQHINLLKHHFYLTYGLALEYNNYRFSNDITLLPDTNYLTFRKENIDFKKNKLTTAYLTLPLYFRFESNAKNEDRSFRLGAGVSGGFLIGSYIKQVSKENGKVKFRDDYNLEKVRYGLTGLVGYDWFNLYVHYTASSLFKEGEGPELNPVSVGFIINY